MGINIGVNNVAKNVNNIFVGVDGKARQVKKAYVGVNNIARLVYNADSKSDSNIMFYGVLNGADKFLERKNLNPIQRRYVEAIKNSGCANITLRKDFPGDYTEATFVHEMGHMLDDKIFKLQTTKKTPKNNSVFYLVQMKGLEPI